MIASRDELNKIHADLYAKIYKTLPGHTEQILNKKLITSHVWVGRLNTVKMPLILKLLYEDNRNPSEIHADFW
jgi:hypothetical protein